MQQIDSDNSSKLTVFVLSKACCAPTVDVDFLCLLITFVPLMLQQWNYPHWRRRLKKFFFQFFSFPGKLFIFYSVFYIILGALFSICMKGLYMTLDEKVPRWTLTESRIGDNPGLGFRPMPKNISQGSLIWLDMKNTTKSEGFIQTLDTFLKRKWTNFVIVQIFVCLLL